MNPSKKGIFCWIPNQGNDKADSLAKATLNMIPDLKLKKNNLKNFFLNTIYWPQTENQANYYKEMATIMGQKFPQQTLSSTAHFKRKEAGS